MAYLHYGLKQAEGFIVITGPVGAGKTMLIGHLLDQLNASTIHAAQLLTSNIEPDELLSHILSAFRVEPEDKGRTGQLEAFEDYLFDQLNHGRRVLLIVDEAQNLPHRTLEELRMLSNMDYDGTPLFQVFLVGQPEFRSVLESDKLEQLKQRVIASYHLEGLSEEESREYILHRLGVVGWKDDPAFSDDAFEAIYAETEGRPRRINTLANRLMLYCALEKRHEVTCETVSEVVAELQEEKLSGKSADRASTNMKAAPEPKAARAQSRETANELPRGPKVEEAAPGMAANEDDGGGVDEMAGDKSKNVDEPFAPIPASASVLDRVRARRDGPDGDFDDDAPTGATLSDVATAIAAASASEGGEALSDAESASPPRNGEWRKSLARSVNEARDELKDANASIKKMHQALASDAKQHDKRREKAIANLVRAETMLSELREARR